MLRGGVEEAAEFLRAGGLVVFPTETVYGLGADAFNADAVARVYSTKNRPVDNPLILHVADAAEFSRLAANPPEYAYALIKEFWPGPLTLVAKKNPSLPAWLGGHFSRTTETIGIRMPAHFTARELIEAAGCVIAAPSANIAGKPSPTTLAHVLEDFPDLAGILALDGGDSIVGLESTVVDITGEKPVILRPGAITSEEITGEAFKKIVAAQVPRSPGMKYKHYAPRAEMTVLSGDAEKIAAYVKNFFHENPGRRVGVLAREKTLAFFENSQYILSMGEGEKKIAQKFFSRLREFDRLGVEIIFAEAVPETGLGAAIMDRMRKAAGGRVVKI